MTDDIFVSSRVGADWLARVLLPRLIESSVGGREVAGDSLRRVLELLSERGRLESISDRYTLTRLARTLQLARMALRTALEVEKASMAAAGLDPVVSDFGGRDRFRSIFFPELDALTGMVESAVTVCDVGRLLRECVDLALDLAVARVGSDTIGGTAASALAGRAVALGRVAHTYDEALRVLIALSGGGVPVESPSGAATCRAERARRASDGYRGFCGVFTSAAGDLRCAHVHRTEHAAVECARRLSSTVTKAA